MDGDVFVSLNPHETRTASALVERLFPRDDNGPGAIDIGVLTYVDRALAGPYSDCIEQYRRGLAALDRTAHANHELDFADCSIAVQDQLIAQLEHDDSDFFEFVRAHLQEGLFADPIYGGNRDKLGWKTLGHPGIWLENSAEENLMETPADKGGKFQSLADVVGKLPGGIDDTLPGYDPTLGASPPTGRADVVIVGVGAVGGLFAPILAKAGLKSRRTRSRAVALHSGLSSRRTWRGVLLPGVDGSEVSCRNPTLAPERQRINRRGDLLTWPDDEQRRRISRSLRRLASPVPSPPLRAREPVRSNGGASPPRQGSTVADWPITYDELEPYFCRLELQVGSRGRTR